MKLFMLDVPVAIIAGFISALIHKRVVDRQPSFVLYAGLLLTLFLWLSALLSAFGTNPWFGIIGKNLAKPINGWLALFLVLSYPLWFIWGTHRAFALFGHTRRQGGLLWLITLEDKTEPFKPAWEQPQKESCD